MSEDPATLRLLAFIHPVWMVMSLALAIWTARLGLEIRRRIRRREPVGSELRRQHMRFGKTTLVFVALGFGIGPLSMVLFRGRDAFDSFHSILGLIVLGLFAWTGWTGRALAAGDTQARSIHRLAAGTSLAAALLAAVAGFILLP